MNVIVSEKYGKTVAALMADPIIVQMAASIPNEINLDGFGFMNAALREYHKRGGQVATHIGGPAEAIKKIKEGK